jgi:hypothetical protein
MPPAPLCHFLGSFYLQGNSHDAAAKRPLPKTALRVLGDYKDTGRATWDEDNQRPPELDHTSFDIHDLLLQRALQTQSRYYRETRNDLQADWMLGFLNHEHLGSGDKWHSVIGMRVHFTEYLRSLMREPVHAFQVSVRQGVTEGRFNAEPTPPPGIEALEKAAALEVEKQVQEEGDKATKEMLAAIEKLVEVVNKEEEKEEEEEVVVESDPTKEMLAAIAKLTEAVKEGGERSEHSRAKPAFDGEGDVKFGLEDAAGVAQQKAAAQGQLLDSMAGTAFDGASRPPMTVHPELMGMWAQAAASRRSNPYLQQAKGFEYTDYIEPRVVAESVMRVCRVLSSEWLDDLKIIAKEDNDETRQEKHAASRARQKHCREHPDDEECAVNYDDLEVPAFEQAERARESDSTPLRRLNFELLQRSSTILGIKSLQTELAFGAMTEKKKAQELIWFDAFVEGWWGDLAGVDKSVARGDGSDIGLDSVSDRLFEALELSMPTILKGHLIDPQSIADLLHTHRERSALQLARQLKETDQILENLVIDSDARIKLEKAM